MRTTVLAGIAGLVALAVLADAALGQEVRRVRGLWPAEVKARSLNVRGGPGENFDIVDKVGRGETIIVVDQVGRWVRLHRDEEAWVHRRFISLPDDFMVPAFSAEENAFLEWAGAREDLEEVSVDGDGRLSIVLADETPAMLAKAGEVAQAVGCAYREQVGYEEPVTVTVWPVAGPSAGWIEQATCP